VIMLVWKVDKFSDIIRNLNLEELNYIELLIKY
jgi:hypothetical protein